MLEIETVKNKIMVNAKYKYISKYQGVEDPFQELFQFVYLDVVSNQWNVQFFQERAILAPVNKTIDFINDFFLYIYLIS